MAQDKPLLLVDASSYLYRAFFAMPPLVNSKGEPTGAVYGVINMVGKLLVEYDPEYVALIFDAKGKTFRDDLYAEYKANRARMPEELNLQIIPLHAIIHAMGLPLLAVQGVEADDVIGTLAAQATALGLSTVVSTGDKDFAQLVDEHVTLIDTMSNNVLNPQGVLDKFGIHPRLIVDYFALVGDGVDNIPGVPMVGPVTALKWLKQYGSLDNIVEHAGEIAGKVGENLRASLAQLPVSRQLLTIKCDVALPVSPDDLRRREPDVEALREWYTRLEFKGWLARLNRNPSSQSPSADKATLAEPAAASNRPDPAVYQAVTTEAELQTSLDSLEQTEQFCFAIQTSSQDYRQARIVGVAFALGPGNATYVPLAHDYPGAPEQLALDEVLKRFRSLWESPSRAKVGHDLKFAMNVLSRYGISVAGPCFDTMLESYVLDSTATRHDLDSLALKYLEGRAVSFEDIAGKGAKQLAFNQVTVDQAGLCAAEDADLCLRLHQVLWPKLAATEHLQRLFNEIEAPLIAVLSRIERNGVRIDTDLLQAQSAELDTRLREIECEAHAIAGEPFNLGSPLQIQQILYDKLGLPMLQKTPKGQPSTAEPVLQELALDYPLPRLILQHRGLDKLKSTYTDTLPRQVSRDTQRVHTCYHQAVTATGRLSSSDPNLQNIPIRSNEGRRIRQAFIAAPGYKILAADYSQIELRIMAHLSGDKGLLRAFTEAEDVHKITAAEVFAVKGEVTHEQRRAAKTINFGLIYGMSSFGLARQLGTDRLTAQRYLDRYFKRYPGVKAFMESTRVRARESGYVETLSGRRLYLPNINDRNAQRRQYAERTAINAPMQGSAADIIKLAMLRVDSWLRESGVDGRMIMQVHDELVFEIAEGALVTAREAVRRCMTEAMTLSVPLLVEMGVGANWDEAH